MTDPNAHLDSYVAEVWELLEQIGQETTDSPGITRAAWSRNDEMAADRVRAFARRHGLQVLNDAFGKHSGPATRYRPYDSLRRDRFASRLGAARRQLRRPGWHS